MKLHESIHTENIVRSTPSILAMLLRDQTLSNISQNVNICWATDDYEKFGTSASQPLTHFKKNSQIYPEDVSGVNIGIITPRVAKHSELQSSRAKSKAEVFTPSWICNAQNNLIDEQWFGRKDVFNKESTDCNGNHIWTATNGKIDFEGGRKWMTYVKLKRMEMACGEAPYIVSRYDATSGEKIAIKDRIGIIDRKFRIVNENTSSIPTPYNKRHWLRKIYLALQSVYGFDCQGDNVFLARESLFHSFCDYYIDRWDKMPNFAAMMKAAEIISWNIWQMDGINFKTPNSEGDALIMEWHGIEPLRGKTMCFKELIK